MNPRLKKLFDARAKALREQEALVSTAEADGRLTLNDDEKAKYTALKAQITEIDAAIEDEKIRVAAEKAQAALPTDTPAAAPRITVGAPNADKDKAKGFKSPRDLFTCIMQAALSPNREDERLKAIRAPLGPMAAAGSDEQSTFSDAKGGYMLPEAFSPDVLRIEPEDDPMAGLVRRIPMGAQIVKMPARVDKNHATSVTGGLIVTRRAESAEGQASTMNLERITLEAFTLFGLAYATEEILTDSPVSFAGMIASGFSQEFTSRIIDERLNGTGVGEFLGILNSPALIAVAAETGQLADTILYENVVQMRSRCWGYSNAVWLANHDTMPQLMTMAQIIGTGGVPIWQGATEDAPDRLLGRPVIFTEYAQTLGDQGDLILANFMEFLEGVYQPLQSAESMHVRFLAHERVWKFWMRNAGAPWWRSALTPKNSTRTLSPFVVLAAR